MTFAFIAKHRGIWPAGWLCEALGVSRAGFYAWRTRPPSVRARADEQLLIRVRASFLTSDRTYGARRVWHDLLVEGVACGPTSDAALSVRLAGEASADCDLIRLRETSGPSPLRLRDLHGGLHHARPGDQHDRELSGADGCAYEILLRWRLSALPGRLPERQPVLQRRGGALVL